MHEPIGLYIHVPFCVSKCPYCDFYSLPAGTDGDQSMDAYTAALLAALDRWAARINRPADTLYFGGGTPSLLGPARLTRILERAAARFGLAGAEITLEANPGDDLTPVLRAFHAAGGNRLSLGMQSAHDRDLAALGRRHRYADVARAAEAARLAGIGNLSLDLMLGLPGQETEAVVTSVEACRALGAGHVSAYLLKLEPGTPFYARRQSLCLPEEDAAAELYLAAAQALEDAGYRQYEIANFARPGRESRHNSKYWDQRPYLGLGPAAHSFLEGRRFYYARDLGRFLAGEEPLTEEDALIPAGSEAEYLMLRMRLTAGITEAGFAAHFGHPIPADWRQRAAALARQSAADPLLVCTEEGFRLTRRGCLVSNAVIARLLCL